MIYKISIILFIIIFLSIAIFTYLIILGANRMKTAEEKEIEDQEQMKYLKNYKEKQEREKQCKKK